MEDSRMGGHGIRAMMGVAAIVVILIVIYTWPRTGSVAAPRAQGAGLIRSQTPSETRPPSAPRPVESLEPGMSMEAVIGLLGEPSSQAAAGDGTAGFALWRYGDGWVLRFQDGGLVSWQEGQTVSALPPAKEMTPEDQQLAAAYWLLAETARTGAFRKVNVARYTVWVDPLGWAMLNRDQKETLINICAGCFEAIHGVPGCTIRSYSDDEVLGELGFFGAKIKQ